MADQHDDQLNGAPADQSKGPLSTLSEDDGSTGCSQDGATILVAQGAPAVEAYESTLCSDDLPPRYELEGRRVVFTRAKNVTKPDTGKSTWLELDRVLTWLERSSTVALKAGAQKKAIPIFSLARFEDDYRSKDKILSVSGLVIDVDNPDPLTPEAWVTPQDFVAAFPFVRGVVYTSYSHQLGKDKEAPRPKFRVVYPFLRDVSMEEYEQVCRRFAWAIKEAGIPLDAVDEASWDGSRGWLMPGQVKGHPKSEAFQVLGAALDPDTWLELPEPSEDLTTKRRKSIKQGLSRPAARRSAPASSPLEQINAIPISDVIERLGCGVVCPRCGDSSDSVGVAEKINRLCCRRTNNCTAPSYSPTDLIAIHVARVGVEGKIDKEAFRTIVEWVRDQGWTVDLPERKKSKKAAKLASLQADGDSEDRPRIIISTAAHEVIEEAVESLTGDETLYRRGDMLVFVERGESGLQIREHNEHTMRPAMSQAATWLKVTKEDVVPAMPPTWAIRGVLAKSWVGRIRTLEGIATTPVLRHDGSLVSESGYDEASGWLYDPFLDFGFIPERPSRQQALDALQELFEVVVDFPFEGPMDRAVWLSGVLTALGRTAIAGPTPLTVVDGNHRGAGKGKLVEAAGTIVSGEVWGGSLHGNCETEWKKAITSALRQGSQTLIFDNVVSALGGGVLESALTASQWTDRILGVSQNVTLPIQGVTWWATGNNVEIVGDMDRRCLSCRLETPEEKPEDRKGFRHPNLIAWIKQERARLVRAGLIVLRAYIAAGTPDQGVRLGSYEAWAALVPSALVWLGQPNPCKSRERYATGASSDSVLLGALIDAWLDELGKGETIRASALLRAIQEEDQRRRREKAMGMEETSERHKYEGLRDAMLALCGSPRLPSARELGSALGRFRNRNVGGRRLVSHYDNHRKSHSWAVEEMPEGEGCVGLARSLPVAEAQQEPTPAPVPPPERDPSATSEGLSDELLDELMAI